MSLSATRWAWGCKSLTPAQTLILLALADRADSKNQCHPSLSRLVADTRLYIKTINAALFALEDVGLIRVDRYHGRASKYTLTMVENHPPTMVDSLLGQGLSDHGGKAPSDHGGKPPIEPTTEPNYKDQDQKPGGMVINDRRVLRVVP